MKWAVSTATFCARAHVLETSGTRRANFCILFLIIYLFFGIFLYSLFFVIHHTSISYPRHIYPLFIIMQATDTSAERARRDRTSARRTGRRDHCSEGAGWPRLPHAGAGTHGAARRTPAAGDIAPRRAPRPAGRLLGADRR